MLALCCGHQSRRQRDSLNRIDQRDVSQESVIANSVRQSDQVLCQSFPDQRLVEQVGKAGNVLLLGQIAVEVQLKVDGAKNRALCVKNLVDYLFLLLVEHRRAHTILINTLPVVDAEVVNANAFVKGFARYQDGSAAHQASLVLQIRPRQKKEVRVHLGHCDGRVPQV